jgi:hypothetical protein
VRFALWRKPLGSLEILGYRLGLSETLTVDYRR